MLDTVKKTVVCTVLVGGTCIICYYGGQQKANQINEENIMQSKIAQELTLTELENTKIDNMINSIQKNVEIVLTHNQGNTTLKLQRYDATWNKFLTEATVEIALDIDALVGINVDDIEFIKDDNGLSIKYSVDDFKILSLEILNTSVISERDIFAKGYTDDEKSAITKYMTDEEKKQIIQDKDVIKHARQSIYNYLKSVAEEFGVNAKIIEE